LYYAAVQIVTVKRAVMVRTVSTRQSIKSEVLEIAFVFLLVGYGTKSV